MKTKIKQVLKLVGGLLGLMLLLGAAAAFLAARASLVPDNLNMSSNMDMGNMDMSDMSAMGTPSPDATLLTTLVQGPTLAPVKAFTLTAETAQVDIGGGRVVSADTYNGTLPGPELRVEQGDLVQVTLINHLSESTTIHWHGLAVPNAEDGVAGVTQDAVQPGATYTYRFLASQPGTYWYHAHQDTSFQLPHGLYGALVIEPRDPPVHYDHDYTVVLHEWPQPGNCFGTCPELLMMDSTTGTVRLAAKPGETVRLRIIAGGDDGHEPVLVGAPFKVLAIDGHDLNGPTALQNVKLSLYPGQRNDVSFVMPASGPVALLDSDARAVPANQHPRVVIGDGQPGVDYVPNLPAFDWTHYGAPADAPKASALTLSTAFTLQYDMELDNQLGFYNGHFTMRFLMGGQTYPNIPALKVNLGDRVKIHIVNNGAIPHAMHLHGHVLTVLAHNGLALTGSPVQLDDLTVLGGESYDVAFIADNPGLWMLHCHFLVHDAQGMDMMVVYPNIFTPYTVGSSSGNNPF